MARGPSFSRGRVIADIIVHARPMYGRGTRPDVDYARAENTYISIAWTRRFRNFAVSNVGSGGRGEGGGKMTDGGEAEGWRTVSDYKVGRPVPSITPKRSFKGNLLICGPEIKSLAPF